MGPEQDGILNEFRRSCWLFSCNKSPRSVSLYSKWCFRNPNKKPRAHQRMALRNQNTVFSPWRNLLHLCENCYPCLPRQSKKCTISKPALLHFPYPQRKYNNELSNLWNNVKNHFINTHTPWQSYEEKQLTIDLEMGIPEGKQYVASPLQKSCIPPETKIHCERPITSWTLQVP